MEFTGDKPLTCLPGPPYGLLRKAPADGDTASRQFMKAYGLAERNPNNQV